MKTAFSFSNWNMIIGFMLSWGVWIIMDLTAFKRGWITTSDSFIIVSIFTIVSYIRSYVLARIFHKNILKK